MKGAWHQAWRRPGSPGQWGRTGAAGLAGLCLALWLGAPDLQALEGLEAEVVRLEDLLQTPAKALPAGPALPVPDWPTPGEAAAFWLWLQQGLQSHRLQLLALHPQGVAMARGLPEQGVRLRVQGLWQDWLRLEQALDAQAPWWVTEQWQVWPASAGSQEMRIELQARLGWAPAAPQEPPTPARQWPVWAAPAPVVQAAVPSVQTPMGSPASSPARQGAADAGRGPELRLLGIWRQPDGAYAVLDAGQQQLVVKSGQPVAGGAWRLRQVGEAAVQLQGQQAGQRLLHLTMQGSPP